MTRPRLVLNQRLTMVAPSTVATAPDPTPEKTPQVAMSCHDCVMNRESPVEADITTSEAITVLRRPMRSIKAAAKGPVSP